MSPDGEIVVDASVVVDLVVGGSSAGSIAARISDLVLHAPAHIDAEVLSAIGRLHRAGVLTADEAGQRLDVALDLPIERRLVDGLVLGAWRRRHQLRLADALYVELASMLGVGLLTMDAALGRAAPIAEVLSR